jgi:hypothetical protein
MDIGQAYPLPNAEYRPFLKDEGTYQRKSVSAKKV